MIASSTTASTPQDPLCHANTNACRETEDYKYTSPNARMRARTESRVGGIRYSISNSHAFNTPMLVGENVRLSLPPFLIPFKQPLPPPTHAIHPHH